MAHIMSQDEFTINGSTTLKIDTGNQSTGKILISDANGMLDWGNTTTISSDGWYYVNNVIPSGGGATVINLSSNTHHTVVNNQGDTNYATNKVRLVLPTGQTNFERVRITLMSEPLEVYIGSTEVAIFFSSKNSQSNNVVAARTRGPVSLSTFTANTWFVLRSHCTVEFTRFQYVSSGSFFEPSSRSYWILTNASGYTLSRKV